MKPKHKQKSAIDLMKRFASILTIVAILFSTVPLSTLAADSKAAFNINEITGVDNAKKNTGLWYKTQILPAKREAAAADFKTMYSAKQKGYGNPMIGPGGTPHYFGLYPNYANTPLIRKFVDRLPGLGAASKNDN